MLHARTRWEPLIALMLTAVLAACGQRSTDELLASGKRFLADGDVAAATIQFKSALQQSPESGEARLLLGRALLESGDAASAVVELGKARDSGLAASAVAPDLARAMLQLGQVDKVLETFGAATIDDAAAAADVKTSVALAHARAGRMDTARRHLDEALTARADLPYALLTQARFLVADGQAPKALQVIDRVLADKPGMAGAWVQRAETLLFGVHDPAAARQAYLKALEVRPGLLPAHFGLMSLLLYQQDTPAAQARFEKLKEIAPNHPQTRFLESQLAFLGNDHARALTLVQSVLKQAPGNARVLTLEGLIQLKLNAPLLAEASLNKAISAAPGEPLARKLIAQVHLRLGQPTKVLSDLERLLALPQPEAEVLAMAGDASVMAGDMARAEQYFRRAVEVQPDNFTVRTAIAVSGLAKGDAQAAFDELKALAKSSSSDVADMAIVSARMRRGEWDQALEAIEALKKKQPDKPLPWDLEARVRVARKEPAPARQAFERARQLDAGYFPAIAGLSRLDLVEGKPDDARRRIEEHVARHPQDTQARLVLAELRTLLGASADEVARSLDEAVRLDPTSVDARIALARHYLHHKMPKQALAVAQEATTRSPEHLELLEVLASAQTAAQELHQAISTYSRLATLRPTSIYPHLRQAEVYVMQRKWDAAAMALKTAVELEPNNFEVHRRLTATAMFAKDPAKAIGYARAFQARQPHHAGGYLLEAEIEGGRKNWPATIALLRKGLAVATAERAILLPKLYTAHVAQGRRDDADEFAGKWLTQHPNDSRFMIQIGEFWLLKADFPAAERYFARATKIEPENASALNNLAWSLLKQRKPGALDVARKAASLAREILPIQETLMLALDDAGQLDEAIAVAQRLTQKAPEAPAYRLALARLYVKNGKPELARPHLEALATLGDKFSGRDEVQRLLGTGHRP